MTSQKRKNRVQNSTYVEITSGRRCGAFKEIPLKSQKKRKQEAPKPSPTLDSYMQDIEPVFEQLIVEDGDPYTFSNTSARPFFISCLILSYI